MFKAGDKVVCVEGSNYGADADMTVTEGETYMIARDQADERYVRLTVGGLGWFASRFVLAPAEPAPEPEKLFRNVYDYAAAGTREERTQYRVRYNNSGGCSAWIDANCFEALFEEIPPAPVYTYVPDEQTVIVYKDGAYLAALGSRELAEEYAAFKKAQES